MTVILEQSAQARATEPPTDAGEQTGRALLAATALCGIALASGWILGRLDLIGSQIELLLYIIAYLAGGTYATVTAVRSLWARTINIDTLMVLAALGAAIIGQWAEGAILLFLFSLGNALQAYAMGRTYRAVRALMELSPNEAVVLREGQEVRLPVDTLEVGDLLLVRPGERIAVDGIIASGQSSIDQAAITGESMPVFKQTGDAVFSGTINGEGALTITATKRFSESTLAKIIAIVKEAQAQKSSAQRFTDRFEGIYAGGVIAAASLYALLPWLALDRALSDSFYQAMILLVVASPCALVISTPASILSALANAARHGILIKGALYLEDLGTTRVVAFDKTGTLTLGKPRVTAVRPAPGVDERELLALAAGAERRSEHPLARAIVTAATERGLALPEAGDLQAHIGRGIEVSAGDTTIFIGNDVLMAEAGVPVAPAVTADAEALRAGGNTTMLVALADARGSRALGVIGVADTVRPAARKVVEQLHALGVEKTLILTGDNARAAHAIAEQTGIDDYRSDLLPREKLDVIEELKRQYGTVVMVGDGVNDAPALATATIGVALGAAGTDVALETADVVLMADDLEKLPYAVALSRKARRVIRQNLTFALTVITLLVIGTFAGITTLPIGVIGHEGSTIIVVANGLRLLGGVARLSDGPPRRTRRALPALSSRAA
jgi:Zn2+/Cd2+-exporting ATPase